MGFPIEILRHFSKKSFSDFLNKTDLTFQGQITVEMGEFSTCYEYSDDKTPIEIKCDKALQDKTLLFLGVTTIIGIGIFSLVKGVKGTWDQDVKPEEMLGPGGDKKDSSSNDDK